LSYIGTNFAHVFIQYVSEIDPINGSVFFKYQSDPECLSDIGSRFQSGLSIEEGGFVAALRFSGISENEIRKGTKLMNTQLKTACERHGVAWTISPERRLDDMRNFAFGLRAQLQQAGEEMGVWRQTWLTQENYTVGPWRNCRVCAMSLLAEWIQVSRWGAILRLG
jgi:hypothetical protein